MCVWQKSAHLPEKQKKLVAFNSFLQIAPPVLHQQFSSQDCAQKNGLIILQIIFQINSCNEFLDGDYGHKMSIKEFVGKYLTNAQCPESMYTWVYGSRSTLVSDNPTELVRNRSRNNEQEWLSQNIHGEREGDFKTVMRRFGMPEAPAERNGEKYADWLKRVPEKLEGESKTDADRCVFRKLYAATYIILMCRTASNLAQDDGGNQDANHRAVFEAFRQVLKVLHNILYLSPADFGLER